MNRFRNKKKAAKDDLVAPPRMSGESESSSPFKMFAKKKPQEETKEEIDLAAALPPSDDFRTSLLMTGLSARFSMLREQDDPNTKVGKASDDSVLFPKRQSRLMDFGFSAGLGDIAEVESIRAPFARDSSYNSDDGSSISGSIMSRAKPTEGNNLFGGRQKIYKIAANGGATSGRALYDHDVAQSAFQKWRQSEKENDGSEDQQSDSFDSEPTRPDSPQSEYNRRRETSSTTSSGPSAGARDSTAATSITSSQPSASIKEWQNAAAAAAANPTPPLERSFTRTRRLYEQSLNQEMHNQQTSALSRIDTLSKQRNFTNRTPDLTPSPASATFGDRFSNTRSVLTKASAPNLRSFSPPTTISSQASPLEPQNKFSALEERVAFGSTPPLSPPISETGESRSFMNDKSKIASMSVLAKAAMYDESTYAQRQIQLQQGRETPTTRFRNESSISVGTLRSRSRSPSVHRGSSDKHDSNASMKAPVGLRSEGHASTFFDDGDDILENIPIRPGVPQPPQVTVERPADNEHPAFRKPAALAPLTIDDNQDHESPEDSPTLGPTRGGLSGMVRAHLRQDSNASSVYGSVPNESDLASRFPPERDDVQIYEPLTTKSSTWESIEQGVAMSMDTDLPSPTRSRSSIDPQDRTAAAPSAHDSKIDLEQENEPDDFARHLADGARRVRERLTSYVESDSGSIAPAVPPLSELPPPPRANALGILKAKSSRGSLVDKNRGEQGQTKAKKLLGLGSTTQSPGPYTPRPESAQADYDAKQEQALSQFRQSEDGYETSNEPSEKDNVHAGLKAFRQARRELQKMKEMEVQQRYQPPSRERAPSLRGPDSRQASRERRAPPVSFNRMPSDDIRNGAGSRSNSRAPSYRDRSGSENSNNDGRSGSRPPRARSGSIRDEIQPPMGSPGSAGAPRQGGMIHMNQGRNASPARFNQFGEPPALSYDQVPQMTRPRDPSDPPMMSAAGLAGLRGPIPSPMAAPSVAPPLPPINPRRKTNTMNELAPRRPGDESGMPSQRFPVSPMSAAEGRGAGGFPVSDDENPADYQQRLRKAASEANGMNARARSLRNSPPHPRGPPPMPPGMARGGLPGGMI